MTIREALYAQFSDVPSRKGRGGTYSYLRWQDVADRMNEVFGTGWSSSVEYQDVIGGNVIVRVRVQAVDPETGNLSFQEGFGGAPNDDRTEAGNNFKAAYSKALKDACKKWGVGLYLDKAEEAAIYGNPPPAQQSNPVPPTPSMPAAPQVTTNTAPPTYTPATPNSSMEMPSSVSMGGSPGPAPQTTPPTEPIVVAQQPQTQTIPAPPTSMTPPMPQQTTMVAPQATEMNKVQTISEPGGGEALISDVQKAALNSILSMQGVEYGGLVRDAFETNGLDGTVVPKIDELTYNQAVCVVKYGNDKFRSR